MEYLPSKYVPSGATYRARATIELPMTVEDALLCFMDFSSNKLKYARDYKDLKTVKVVRCTGTLPGQLPEESIVVATLNFEGFLWFLKPFLPSKVTLQCTIEEDPSCPGRYDWSQQTLGADGKPDGRNKKAGSIQLHPSGDAGRCMISSLSEVPSWLPVWVLKYAAPKTKTYLGEYTDRYLAYKKQSASA
ncbi:unnamed protein product [Symbiodinium pilosum]|uniref:Uncharacterized protein n=1 Tax=Symbiodinium pilosum TaxID=2952 RepID=A0A812VP19_SYMPI|nr:unnamed protein product [Symbiodinium pilosum]